VSSAWLNPYRAPRGEWLRGNLHFHSQPNSGCASVPLAEGLRRYADLGYDFLAVTDHDCVTDLGQLRVAYAHLILLEGFEHSWGKHAVFLGERVSSLYEVPLAEALHKADGLLTIASHPQTREEQPTWTVEQMREMDLWPDGIEIVNGHYGVPRMRARGLTSHYVRFWDELLTAGCRLWGFANDDFHDPIDLGNAFNVVLAERRAPQAILRAFKDGRFYASTGLCLERIDMRGGTILVHVRSECAGRFVGPSGKALYEAVGQRFAYTPHEEAYVRFEARGDAGELYTQPFWRVA